MSPQEVDVQHVVWIHSADTDLRMREKHAFMWIVINMSGCLSVRFFRRAAGHSFSGYFKA